MTPIITADEARAMCGKLLPIVESEGTEEWTVLEAVCDVIRNKTQMGYTSDEFHVDFETSTFLVERDKFLDELRSLGYDAELTVRHKDKYAYHTTIRVSWEAR